MKNIIFGLIAVVVFGLVAFFTLHSAEKVNEQVATPARSQMFDFDWKFKLGDPANAQSFSLDDQDWRDVNLPHDWSIESEPDAANPSGNDGGYYPAGIAWYRKHLQVPDSWKGKQIGIYFEGVYENSEIFINGISIGKRPYGYSSFYYDLTPHLNFGGQNVIAVKVDNAQQKNSRWYSGSGIYRHVWLYVKNPVHINHWGVSITTPEVSAENASVKIVTVVSNKTAIPQEIEFSIQLRVDQESAELGNNTLKAILAANSEKEFTQTIEIKQPKLWSPDTPNLYQAQIHLGQGKVALDTVTKTFGVRSIAFSADKGFQLNGKTIKLYGGSVHHDNGGLGAKAFDRAEERRVELLKAAGFNTMRTAHNPPSSAFLRACDRLGLLVIDEAFDGWREHKTPYDYSTYFDKWWKSDLTDMVKRDRNHPSIVMWSVGNEIIERTEPSAITTANELVGLVHELDSTRPVTSGMTTWGQGWEVFDSLFTTMDIGGYNYQLDKAVADHKRVPSRVIVQTESYPKDAFTNWQLVKNNSYIIGDFVWTAIDYLGESGIGRYYYPGEPTLEHWEQALFPWHGAYSGDIDITGWRKPISHYRSMLFDGAEKLYMAVREPNPATGPIKLTVWAVWPTWESWSWPGYEGKIIDVEIYSRYPIVRLYQDGKLIGEQATGEQQEFKATFPVNYQPGVLKAVGVLDGNEIGTVSLQTSGTSQKIALTADRSTITADGQDLSFVTVNITDINGLPTPNANNELDFSITGPGEIEAVVTADMTDSTSYISHSRKAWKGRALVVIRSKRTPGQIILKASGVGFADTDISLLSVKKELETYNSKEK